MSALVDKASKLIDSASEEERQAILAYLRRRTVIHPLEKQWDTTAEAILSAISRASDLTQRGVRGILAEAVFEEKVLPSMAASGWHPEVIHDDRPFDFALQRDSTKIRIQVKLQRREKGVPKQLSRRLHVQLRHAPESLFVVEVQKTRSGNRAGQQTRPYHFGDFDILAVNLHPSTGIWTRFLYAPASWLLPRVDSPELINVFQPVPAEPDEYWSDDLETSIEWFSSGRRKRLYS